MLANALFKICMCKADFSFDLSSMSLVASHVFGDIYFYNRVGVIGGGGVGWANKVHVCSRNYVMLR